MPFSKKTFYPEKNKLLLAVDCVIFGYNEGELKLLVFKREVDPLAGQWSLIGNIVSNEENLNDAAHRILKDITGLEEVFLEQLCSFGDMDRDSGARVVSVVYWSLIQSSKNQGFSIENHEAKWVPFDQVPDLVLDHNQMVETAITKLRDVARYRPIGFELLPEKFTLPQLLKVYEAIYQRPIDDRNFRKKILATGLLIKLDTKDKTTSKKGAFLYKFDSEKYQHLLKSGYWFEV
ncbi:NUDIX domain-containing protein [Reichenbachiella sp. MALMAid0571]|uniref:NUDIX hydrolase n=1 Tax=Reichenbachiella sp. MALMAid0571 TaxID=3143939 RepID=UPI0032E04320